MFGTSLSCHTHNVHIYSYIYTTVTSSLAPTSPPSLWRPAARPPAALWTARATASVVLGLVAIQVTPTHRHMIM